MKTLQSIDLYLWKHFFSDLNPALFKAKFVSVISLAYIALFPLPRKFIKHYFSGTGEPLEVDTKKVICENPEVFDKLISDTSTSYAAGLKSKSLAIPQIYVNHPNYNYSLGSFTISYYFEDTIIKISLRSKYQYRKNINRVTKHIHNWLFSLKEKGKAKDFDIKGSDWILPYSELHSSKVNNNIRKYVDFNRLYM